MAKMIEKCEKITIFGQHSPIFCTISDFFHNLCYLLYRITWNKSIVFNTLEKMAFYQRTMAIFCQKIKRHTQIFRSFFSSNLWIWFTENNIQNILNEIIKWKICEKTKIHYFSTLSSFWSLHLVYTYTKVTSTNIWT